VSGQLLDRLQSLLTLPISANSKGHVVAAQLLAELAKAGELIVTQMPYEFNYKCL